MVVVDSVAALVPKAEIEGEIGDSHVALQARLMSQAMRKLTGQKPYQPSSIYTIIYQQFIIDLKNRFCIIV